MRSHLLHSSLHRSGKRAVSLLAASFLALGVAGCRCSSSPPPAAALPVCSECYDVAHKVWVQSPRSGGHPKISVRHKCAACAAEMSIDDESGTLRMHCPKCAPEGVDCDRCRPRDEP